MFSPLALRYAFMEIKGLIYHIILESDDQNWTHSLYYEHITFIAYFSLTMMMASYLKVKFALVLKGKRGSLISENNRNWAIIK